MLDRLIQLVARIKWRMWRFRIVWWVWATWVVTRYVITGDCGCACTEFIPEAECPIHDVTRNHNGGTYTAEEMDIREWFSSLPDPEESGEF